MLFLQANRKKNLNNNFRKRLQPLWVMAVNYGETQHVAHWSLGSFICQRGMQRQTVVPAQ